MATSTLYRSSPLGPHSGSPGSCSYMPRQAPKADWRASFANINGANPISLILRQHNGVWLPGSTDNSFNKEQPQFIKEKVAQDTVTSPTKSRLSLGKVTKILRCHVCRSIVKDHQFHSHLFFGPVRCELCFIVCHECPVFEQLSLEAELESGKCQHRFWYCEDPYDYLLTRLSGSNEHDVVEMSTLPHSLRLLQKYVKTLENLQLMQPWSDALRKCKRHLLKAYSTSSSEPSENAVSMEEFPLPTSESLKDVSSQKLPSRWSTMEDTHDNEETDGEKEELNSSVRDMQGRLKCHSPAGRVSPADENLDDGLLLTQSYDLEHLEQAVEYVKVDAYSTKSSGPSSETPQEKSKHKKRRKLHHNNKTQRVLTPEEETQQLLNQRQEQAEEELVLEQVEMPENGHYLMVRGTVEECPMCYEDLDPTMCTVNMRTCLLTVHCPGCRLIIYMVPDVPNGLQIVTEDINKTVEMAPQKVAKVKSRRISPRDFFAS